MAEVGQYADIPVRSLHQEADGIVRIMRNRKRLHHEIAQLKAVACGEQAADKFGLELSFQRVLRRTIAINGDFQFLSQSGQTLDMVVVLVCDEDSREIFRRASDRG